MSLDEASLLAWVKHYRPDENTGNSAVSYYLKGALVALALDLRLRRAGRSLDWLLRLLLERHAESGLPEDGVERACAEALGDGPARAFFDRHVRGTEPVEPDLDLVGLSLRRRRSESFDDKGGTPPKGNGQRPAPGFLGADLAPGGKLLVRSTREGSPAWRAGLYAEDEIVAEAGFRLVSTSLHPFLNAAAVPKRFLQQFRRTAGRRVAGLAARAGRACAVSATCPPERTTDRAG